MLAGDLMGTVGVRATPRVRWCRRDAYCSRVARAGGSRSERGNIGMMPRWIPACPYPSAWVPGLSQSVSARGAMGLGLGKAAGSVPRALESTVERGSALLRLTCRLEIYAKRRDYLAVSVCGRSPLALLSQRCRRPTDPIQSCFPSRGPAFDVYSRRARHCAVPPVRRRAWGPGQCRLPLLVIQMWTVPGTGGKGDSEAKCGISTGGWVGLSGVLK